MGAPTRPADRRALEGALAAAEVTLGATAYAEIWAVGQTVPLAQIVARAGHDPWPPTYRDPVNAAAILAGSFCAYLPEKCVDASLAA
jgi:hypothetical protein